MILPRHVGFLPLLVTAALAAAAPAATAEATTPDAAFVRLVTDEGAILIALRADLAPHHARNFARLAAGGFYDGIYFHRVIPGFMIQVGDPNTRNEDRRDDGQGGPAMADVLPPRELAMLETLNRWLEAHGYAPLGQAAHLKAEFSRSVRHRRGTVSMARTNVPDSAGSQIFICVADAPSLDGKYSIFGEVVTGMETADRIAAAPRDTYDNPLEPIRIAAAEVLADASALTAAEEQAWAEMRQRRPADFPAR